MSANVTSNTVMWKVFKNHHYLYESVSRCTLPAFLTDYGVRGGGLYVCVCMGGVGLNAGRGLSSRVQGGQYRPEVESERKRTFLWS